MNSTQAWEATLGQLLMEVPKSNYETYIKPTILVSFEEESSTFIIGVPSQYARDWLEDRLTLIITRILSGMMNCDSSIKFILHDQNYEIHSEPSDNKLNLQNEVFSPMFIICSIYMYIYIYLLSNSYKRKFSGTRL